MTEQEQDLINTIAKNLHNNIDITREQIAQITHKMLNSRVTSDENNGLSLAFMLASHDKGHEILNYNCSLTNAIDAKILNEIVKTGEHSGESVAFWLATYLSCDFNAEFYTPGQSINDEALNTYLYKTDEKDNQYMAVMTAAFHFSMDTNRGHKVLSADNYKLALRITSQTLNQINHKTLSYSHNFGEGADIYVGQSTASVLAETESGCQILSAHNDKLAKLIDPELMNVFHEYSSDNDEYKVATAFYFASHKSGVELLMRNPRLILAITSDSLNYIPDDIYEHGDKSLAFALSESETGQNILIQSQLAWQIKSNVLNTIDMNTGKSVAFHLARTNCGLEILRHDDCKLGACISPKTLKTMINREGYDEQSLESCLAKTEVGREILDKIYFINNPQQIIARCWKKNRITFNNNLRIIEDTVANSKFNFKGREFATTCSITQDIITNPIALFTCEPGLMFQWSNNIPVHIHAFEKNAILNWIKFHKKNPLNNIPCNDKNFRDFPELKSFIKERRREAITALLTSNKRLKLIS